MYSLMRLKKRDVQIYRFKILNELVCTQLEIVVIFNIMFSNWPTNGYARYN